ncbi:hypothetical protein AVEN_49215-1 [Araneus ventricosus]|uniref:Uncharacterized protein n=1 Tax=Araneus ventricosus TaxID=182803 RepID=A0A4Y2M260_ARAVE|nr:hypothetical protein AVEN_49215-1 [Araneus ventricosus]
MYLNSSSAEAGVLVAFTDHDPTPSVRGTHYHRQRENRSYYYTHQGSEITLTFVRRLLIDVVPSGGMMNHKEIPYSAVDLLTPQHTPNSEPGRLPVDWAPYTADLQWNRVSNLRPSGPEVETLPLGHRGLYPTLETESNIITVAIKEERSRLLNHRLLIPIFVMPPGGAILKSRRMILEVKLKENMNYESSDDQIYNSAKKSRE